MTAKTFTPVCSHRGYWVIARRWSSGKVTFLPGVSASRADAKAHCDKLNAERAAQLARFAD